MRIGIDLDGPCYAFDKTARYMLRNFRGCKGLEEPSPEWFLPNQSWHNVTDDDYDWLNSEGVKLGLYRYGHVTTGAIIGLRELLRCGHSLAVVTHRPSAAVPDTLAWLAYQEIEWSEVHILSHGESKTQVNADVLVDDKIENAVEWALSDRPVLLYDQPWNQGLDATNVWRVHGWKGVTGVIARLSS